jgi:hypothetical protein
MNNVGKGLARGQKGQALLLAIILLLVAGLIAAPLLAHMGTGILTGEVYQTRTAELYAADAGVEDAVWKIQHQDQVPEVAGLSKCHDSWSYNISGADGGVAEVNDKHVEITITVATLLNNLPCDYYIESRAIGDGSGTQIDAYITGSVNYYPSIMDQLITIQGDLTAQQVKALEQDLDKLDIPCPTECTNCTVCGQAYNYSDYDKIPAGCRGCVAVYNFPQLAWPDATNLAQSYWQDVKNAIPYNAATLNVNGHPSIGPFYRDGALDIVNDVDGLTLKLGGTVYITGKTNMSPNKDTTLDLNGHTIFVGSNATGTELNIGGGKVSIKGPGLIVAVGDINFEPKAQIGTGPVFILSVSGTTTVHPSGDMYGAIAGKVNVVMHAGTTPSFAYPTQGFGNSTFPRTVAGMTYSIASWEVNPL